MTTRLPSEFIRTSARNRSVVDLLDSVLDGIVAYYRQESIPLPERQYWAIGGVPADCEQLTVTLLQTYVGVPGGEGLDPAPCKGPRTAVIGIQIFRKVTTSGSTGSNVPKGTDVQQSSVGPAIDAWAILDAISEVDEFASAVTLSVNLIEPQGGLHGILATYAVQIP